MADWFRSWHGAPTDPKWLAIAARAKVPAGIVSAIAWALLDRASQADDRGSVEGFDIETYAAFSGFRVEKIEAVMSALKEKGVIINGRLAAWDRRQPQREDYSGERVKAFRERRNAVKRDVTQCNAVKREETPEESRGDKTREDTDKSKQDARANDEAVKVCARLRAMVPDQGSILGWHWSDVATFLAAGYTETEIIGVVEKSIARGKTPGNLRYFEPVLRECRIPSAPAGLVKDKAYWEKVVDESR